MPTDGYTRLDALSAVAIQHFAPTLASLDSVSLARRLVGLDRELIAWAEHALPDLPESDRLDWAQGVVVALAQEATRIRVGAHEAGHA